MSIEAPASPARRRRSPEAARENILAAAESLLLEKGPQALKLADVAASAGVVHATVLHHFGSIDDVQTALMERMIRQLVARILDSTVAGDDPQRQADAGARALFDAFESRGAARLAAWLELTGESRRLTVVREAVREVVANRLARDGRVDAETAEDFILVCVALALGVGLFGPSLATLLGRPAGRTRELALDLIRWRMSAVTAGETGA